MKNIYFKFINYYINYNINNNIYYTDNNIFNINDDIKLADPRACGSSSNARLKSLKSNCNARPMNLESECQPEEPEVRTPDPKALGPDDGPKSLGSGGVARPN